MITVVAAEPAPDGGVNIAWRDQQDDGDVEAFTHLTGRLLDELAAAAAASGCGDAARAFQAARGTLDVDLWRDGMDLLAAHTAKIDEARQAAADQRSRATGMADFIREHRDR